MKLYKGMVFKPLSHPKVVGECISVSNNEFTYRWYSEKGEPMPFINRMKMQEAIDCFELYGWKELSELEKELL